MFRLIKLAFYGLVGYMLYELYQGMSAPGTGFSNQPRTRGERDLNRASNANTGRMQTLTGEGVGRNESTVDASGTSATHAVGRGVTTS
jgi:hypothetical protein